MLLTPTAAILGLVCASAAMYAGPIRYQVVDLGALGGSSSAASGINATGQTVGTLYDSYGGMSARAGASNITPAGAVGAQATAINAGGTIAGVTYTSSGAQATVWTNGTAAYLDGLGGTDAMATAINTFGQVTGMAATATGSGHLFSAGNGVTFNLGVLPGGDWASGYGINDSGQIAGYGSTANGSFRAFLWTPEAGFQQLGTFGGMNSYAFALNSSGAVAGAAQASSGYMHAFVAGGTGLQDLGTLGGESSFAYGINSNGATVGYSYTASSANAHAFMYMNGVLYDVNDLVSAAGWEFTAAYAINDTNQIAGTGVIDGVAHAIRLDPTRTISLDSGPPPAEIGAVPEPSALLLSGFGLACLLISSFTRSKRRA